MTANSFISASGVPLGGSEVVYCNFTRLIQRYVRNFVRIDPPAALQYVYLLSLNADAPDSIGEEQVQACWDMIQALILETRSYNLVLSEKTSDGQNVVRNWLRKAAVFVSRFQTYPDTSIPDTAQRAHA